MVWAGDPRNAESLPTRKRLSFLLQRVWTGCGDHPGSQQMAILSSLPGIKCPGLDSKYTPIQGRSRECVQLHLYSSFFFTSWCLIKYRKIFPLPHTDQLNKHIVGSDRSPINDDNDRTRGLFLTVYCSIFLNVTLMYVQESKELVTRKFLHCHHVSEQNRLTAGGGKSNSPKKTCWWHIFRQPHCRSLTLQENHEVRIAIKVWKEENLERSASIRFGTPELPASHMWIPSALAIFINLLIQKIIKGNMVVGKRHDTRVSSFKMIYLFEKFNVRVLRVLFPKEFLIEATICWWL